MLESRTEQQLSAPHSFSRASRSHAAVGSSYSLKAIPAAALLMLAGVAQADPHSAATELDTITVTATMSPHQTRTAPASVTIVPREELEIRNANNVLEAVRGQPGVTMTGQGTAGRKTITLRGMDGRHVLTMVNGRRIAASDDIVGHSDYQYNWTPMSSIERIEIIRGPMSTLYGSEALGGVVNVITRRPTDKWEGELSLGGATLANSAGGDQTNAAVYLGGPVGEKLTLRLTGQTAYNQSIASESDPAVSGIEGSKINMGSIGATIDLTANQTLDLDYAGGLERRFFDASSRGKYYENHYDIRRDQGSVVWNGDFEKWNGQMRAYRSEIDITNYRTNGQSPSEPQNMKEEVVDGYASTTFGRHRLTGGGELRREELAHAELVGGDDSARHNALFLQDEIELGHGLTFTVGARYDDHEIFGNEISPRAYLVWEASDDLVVKGGYGHAFKAPTLKQISPNYRYEGSSYDVLGNPDLRPESLDSFELGADWQVGDVALTGTVFYSKVRDLIASTKISPAGQRSVYQYQNVDRARIMGLEAGAVWDISPSFAWSTSLTLLKTEDQDTGEQLEYRPKLSAASALDWVGPAGWSARVGLEYTGKQYTASGDLPDYILWNASLAKDFGKQVTLRIGLDNIGDVNLEDKSPDFQYAERGRTVFANLQMRF